MQIVLTLLLQLAAGLLLAPTIVAAAPSGAIVELTSTGAIRKELVSPVVTGGPPGHVAVAPSRTSVYFDRGPVNCWSEFAYGGGPGVGGNGARPSLSYDGAKVAVVSGADVCRPDTLLVYEVPAGHPRVWHLDREHVRVCRAHARVGWNAHATLGQSAGD
jgi:hypothetical protein